MNVSDLSNRRSCREPNADVNSVTEAEVDCWLPGKLVSTSQTSSHENYSRDGVRFSWCKVRGESLQCARRSRFEMTSLAM